MRDEDCDTFFDDYILGKKLRLLHLLCTQLYSFAEFSNVAKDKMYRVTFDSEYKVFMLEVRGTELMSVNHRLKIHSALYKKLKPRKPVKLGTNGQTLFFNKLEELWR